jgi:hypothetical protein
MRITKQFVTGIFLVSSALINMPLAVAVDENVNSAFEDYSGTHASTTPKTAEGMRGSEGMKGEAGMAGTKTAMPDINQAFEDYSGTHPTSAAMKTSMKGPSGLQGESGRAGKTDSGWSPFNLPGDVANGCSKYLRCSNE